MRRERSGEKGFTLIEVLIAFTILAISAAGLLESISGSAQIGHAAATRAAALARAEALLLEAAEANEATFGERGGMSIEGFDWRLRIAPYQAASLLEGAHQSAGSLALASFEVTIGQNLDAEPPIARLQTIRLIRGPGS